MMGVVSGLHLTHKIFKLIMDRPISYGVRLAPQKAGQNY